MGDEMSAAVATQTMITFEYPLNESMRLYLRLEHLFENISTNIDQPDKGANKAAIINLIKIINVTERPDIKSKFTQTLTQQISNLNQLKTAPGVDEQQLQIILNKLEGFQNSLHHNHSRIGDRLRKHDFLQQIKSQLNNLAGVCKHTCPALHLWANQPLEQRQKELHHWHHEFEELKQMTTTILNLTRQFSRKTKVKCEDGFYQQTLDPSTPSEILSISLPANYNLYPEFSVGKHRMTIRFMQPNYQTTGRAEQSHKNFDFELSFCRI